MKKAKQTKKIIILFLTFLILFSISTTPISLAAEILNSTYYKIDNSKNIISRVEPETKVEEFKTKMNVDESTLKLYQDKTCITEVTTGLIGTGMALKYDGKIYEISVVGDFNKDGKATQVELTNIIRHIVGLQEAELTGIYYESADLTGDSLVDQRDITKYIRYIVYGELDLGKVDTTPPILTLTTKDVEASSAKVVATALDKEIGMEDNPTYTFYLKKASEPDTSYAEMQKGTKNEFNMTGLISNTEYEVKVVTYDKAGNKAEKTIKLTTTSIQGTLTFSNETWNSGKASIDIKSTTTYTIEYQINSNTGTWVTGTSGKVTVNNLNHNDTIYARLTDGSTRTAEQTKQIKDEIAPKIELTLTKTVSEINITATATDNETGIDEAEEYVFYLDGIEKQRNTSGTCTYARLTADTNYTVKVEITDKAGNIGTKEQTISTGSLPDVTQSGTLTFGAVIWNSGKAQTTISTNTTFTIEYQVNDTADGAWQTIANGATVLNLNDDDVVYARLTDGVNVTNTKSITIEDLVTPNITLNLIKTTSTITVVATAQDNETGIDSAEEYVFYINGVEEQRNTSGTYTYAGLTADTNYTVKVEIEDKAGNVGFKEQSATTENVPSASNPGNIMFSKATWVSEKAEVIISTTTNYCIEYQVNGMEDGTWIAGTVGEKTLTVQNLNHNDVIYARLTDGTNAGNYISQTIIDAISPNVTLNLVPETQKIIATATATDNESGIPTNVTYKFSIKDTGADDSTYVEKQNTTSNICEFTELLEGKDYTIKVEVQDNAQNVGIKEESEEIPDNIAPEVTLTVTSKTSNSITAEASATDVGGMPEVPTYIFYIKKTGEKDTSYTQVQSSSSTTCTFTDLETNTDYTIKVTVQDDAENEGIKEVSCLTDRIPNGTDAGAITFTNIIWTSGKATVTISTSTSYSIEYQVNDTTGTWIVGTTVSNLNHNDIIYARLTDGTNTTSPATCNIVDASKPQVTLSLTPTISDVIATATAQDNESGIVATATYKFSIKKETEPDTSYVEKQNTTSNTCTITGLTQGTNYIVKVEVQDVAGNIGEQSTSTTTLKMPDAETTGALSFSSIVWSSGKASATMSTNTTYTIEYQVNSTTETWLVGTSVANLNHEDTVYARLTDGTNTSNYVTLNVVDAIAPENFTISVTDITYEGFKITGSTTDNQTGLATYSYIAATSSSEIVKEITGQTVTEYTIDGLETGTEYVVYMLAYDSAGNVRKSNEETVMTNIDKDLLQQNIIIKPSTTEWTNNNIQVEVVWGYNNPKAKKEISIDGGTTFKEYTGSFEIEKNTTIIAKIIIEEIEVTKELPITNIDKLEPKDFTPTISDLVSSTEFTINANASDAEATEEYGSSGIKEYQYYVYEGETLIDSSEKITSSSWNASGLTAGNTYDVYVEVWDNAGNVTRGTTKYTKLQVYKWARYKAIIGSYSYSSEEISYRKIDKYCAKLYTAGGSAKSAFDTSTGLFKFSKETVATGGSLPIAKGYLVADGNLDRDNLTCAFAYLITSNPVEVDTYHYSASVIYYERIINYKKTGEILNYVVSINPNEFPDNGMKDNYWYEKVE